MPSRPTDFVPALDLSNPEKVTMSRADWGEVLAYVFAYKAHDKAATSCVEGQQ